MGYCRKLFGVRENGVFSESAGVKGGLSFNLWLMIMSIKYSVTYNVTSNACIAGNGKIPERNDTSEDMKA